MKTAHASWRSYPYVGKAYRVRHRHSDAPSAYSKDGYMWFDSYGKPVSRPAEEICFNRGMKDGQIELRKMLEGA